MLIPLFWRCRHSWDGKHESSPQFGDNPSVLPLHINDKLFGMELPNGSSWRLDGSCSLEFGKMFPACFGKEEREQKALFFWYSKTGFIVPVKRMKFKKYIIYIYTIFEINRNSDICQLHKPPNYFSESVRWTTSSSQGGASQWNEKNMLLMVQKCSEPVTLQ